MSTGPSLADARGIRWLFAVAAAWNIAAATAALCFPAFHVASFYGSGTEAHGVVAQLHMQAFWVSVLLFGLGYAIVARDPRKNHGIILLAAIGKSYVFVVWTVGWSRSEVTTLGLLGGIGDLLFAGVFAWFLWRVHNER